MNRPPQRRRRPAPCRLENLLSRIETAPITSQSCEDDLTIYTSSNMKDNLLRLVEVIEASPQAEFRIEILEKSYLVPPHMHGVYVESLRDWMKTLP